MIKLESFSDAEFLASIGGLLGLFAAVSVLSFIEIIFYVFKWALHLLLRRRKIRKVKPFVITKKAFDKKTSVFAKLSRFLLTFIEKTDVHGFHYIINANNNIFDRIFWISIIMFCTVACYLQVSDVVRHFGLNPIEITIDDKIWTLNDVSFF